jgi:D-3-phosphoglycerate dehydrogenase / 2-oxoglutarate reductase
MARDTTRPTVVVTDHSFGELAVERAILEPLGCTFVTAQCRTEQEAMALVDDADYVITQFAPLTARVIQAMARARLIVRYGVGVDNVDLGAAAERRIPVCNVPDYCTDEVADHTLGIILALTRQIARVSAGIRAGQWTAPPLEAFRALKDLTTGVVGCGRIGRAVIERLRPFKTRILAYDPVLSDDVCEALGCEKVTLERLFATSDLITLHCPSTAQTRQMVNARSLSRMKDGVLLVNVARGTLVDTDALVAALRSGKVGGAGLDVTDPEPINADSPLLAMDNVVITSHIASASVRAASALRAGVANAVARAIRGEELRNCVNGVIAS